MRLKCLLTASLYAMLAASSLAAPSPTRTGTVGGQVLDLNGRPVANAHVTLQATDGDQLQATETNTQGRFWFTFLSEGQYSVRASDPGRVSEWRQGVWVSPGHQTDVTLHLLRRQKSNVSIAFPPLHGQATWMRP
jgi:Carboxypeptidase regulatory-like domain